MTIQQKFVKEIQNICEKYKEKNFITYMMEDDSVENWTYETFWKRAVCVAFESHLSFVKNGDRILVLSPLSPYSCSIIVSLAMIGAVSVVINPELPPEELDMLVEKSDIQGIVCDRINYDKYADKFITKYPVFDITTGEMFDEWQYNRKQVVDADEEVLAILYSSGTTSEPKGVMITYEGQRKSSELLLRAFGTNDIRYLLIFPLFHVSGFSTFFALLFGGGQIGLLENSNSIRLMEGFKKYNPNAFGMVPKVYQAIQRKIMDNIGDNKKLVKLIHLCGWVRKSVHINLGNKIFKKINAKIFGKNMKYLGVGGGRCSDDIAGFFQSLGFYWMNTYASTEMNLPMMTTTVHDDFPLDSVGKINTFPEIQVRIQNSDANGIGEIQVKSPCHMMGYFRDEKATEQAYEDGYFKTGDLGYCDSNRYIHITGRSKESIHLRNGEKVSPEQLEALYDSCIPENVVAACVGVPVESAGYDEIVFFIEKRLIKDTDVVREKIINRAKELGGDYRISDIHFIEHIPLSSIGKVQRYKLRNQQVIDTYISTETEDTGNSVYIQILKIFHELGVKGKIDEESKLEEDLGIDSLNLFELCVEIQKQFGIDITNWISSQLTVKELCEMVEKNGESAVDTVSYDVEQYPMKRRRCDKWMLSLFCLLTRVLYKFEVSGIENIDKKRNYIICSNHTSYLDPIWILTAFSSQINKYDSVTFAAAERMNDSKYFFRMLGCIPVDREKGIHPEIAVVEDCLHEGMNAVIFPEGARSRDGSLLPLKKGVVRISKDTGISILPVYIEGGFEVFPRHEKNPKLFNWHEHKRYTLNIVAEKPINPLEVEEDTMFKRLETILKGDRI